MGPQVLAVSLIPGPHPAQPVRRHLAPGLCQWVSTDLQGLMLSMVRIKVWLRSLESPPLGSVLALYTSTCNHKKAETEGSSQGLYMEAPSWPAHQQFSYLPPPHIKSNKKQEAECKSVCVYSPSSAYSLRGLFFFSFSWHLNLEKPNLEIL